VTEVSVHFRVHELAQNQLLVDLCASPGDLTDSVVLLTAGCRAVQVFQFSVCISDRVPSAWWRPAMVDVQ